MNLPSFPTRCRFKSRNATARAPGVHRAPVPLATGSVVLLALALATRCGHAQDNFSLSEFKTGPQLTAMTGGEYSIPEPGFTKESDPLSGGDFLAGFVIDSIPGEPIPRAAPGAVVLTFEWINGRLMVTVPETGIPGVMEFATDPGASSVWRPVTEVPFNGKYEFATAGSLRFFRWRSLQ